MEWSFLEAFVAVARSGSVSAAARKIHITQPAVSVRIRRLEEQVGERLFHRSGRGVALTAAGSHLLPRAEEALLAAKAFSTAAADYSGVRGGELRIGTTDVASIYILPGAYRLFLRRFSEVELSVRVEGTTSLLAALREGEIEIAVVSLPAEGDDLVVTKIASDPLVAVLPSSHPLAKRSRVDLGQLVATPMITFKRDSVTRRMVEREFGLRGLEPRIGMEISSPEAIRKLVEVGLGFSFLPARSVRREVREGRLASPKITGVRFDRTIGAVMLEGRYLSPAAQAFLDTVKIRGEGKRKGR